MAMADQTLEKFKRHFANSEKEHHDKVTATPAAGYPRAAATANMVQTLTPAALSDLMPELALYHSATAANQAICIDPGGPAITGNPILVSYYWSHGTGSNMAHTSKLAVASSMGTKVRPPRATSWEGPKKFDQRATGSLGDIEGWQSPCLN